MTDQQALDVLKRLAASLTPGDLDHTLARITAAAVEVLRSGSLVQGRNVEALEKAIGEYIGTKHVIAASSGTATLHMALVALGIGPGDEVIVPAFSYVATANVVEIVGAKPVFVDVKPDSFLMDEEKLHDAITPRTKAVIPVDFAEHK